MNFAACHHRLWLLFTVPVQIAPVAPALQSYDSKPSFVALPMGLDQPILNASGANFDPSYRVKLTILILRRVLQQYVKY